MPCSTSVYQSGALFREITNTSKLICCVKENEKLCNSAVCVLLLPCGKCQHIWWVFRYKSKIGYCFYVLHSTKYISHIDSVRLSDIQVLTLYHGKMTAGRRSSPVQQLKCVGGTAGCKAFTPKVKHYPLFCFPNFIGNSFFNPI